MRNCAIRKEIREINTKIFAYAMVFSEEDYDIAFELVIADIIQNGTYGNNNKKVIIPLSESMLNNDTVNKLRLIKPDTAIIQVNNMFLNGEEVISIINDIKKHGFDIIVELNEDDEYFTYAKMLADIVSVDITKIPSSLKSGVEIDCKKLAYNIHTADDYIAAELANIDYFEGNYIAVPTSLELRQFKYSKLNFLEVLKEIDISSDMEKIANIISRDPLLSSQIIRLAKVRDKRIHCIEEALEEIGIERLQRWVLLIQFNKTNLVSEEIIKSSYHRAELAKGIAEALFIKNISSKQAYMIGLLSNLDVLSGKSMKDEITSLNLDIVIEDALIYREGIGGDLLNLIIAYEEARYKKVEQYCKLVGVSRGTVFREYYDSILKVTETWSNLERYKEAGAI